MGHFSKDCPTAGSNVCRNCGEEGHISKECDKPRNPATVTCRNCESMGHFSKDCPKPRDYSKVKCSNCDQSMSALAVSSGISLTRRQWATPNRDARNLSKKLVTEAMAEVTQAVSMPLLVVRTSPLPQLQELEERSMNGAPHLQLRQWEEEVKMAGRCRIVLHLEPDGLLLESS